jgi:hypothetical protein
MKVSLPLRRPGKVRAILALIALACLALHALTGFSEFGLYVTPLALLVVGFLCGLYVGEERIVAAWREKRTPLPRSTSARRPRWLDVGIGSHLERAPRSLRGPPLGALRA